MGRRINRVKLFVNDNEKSNIVAKDLELELVKYGFKIVGIRKKYYQGKNDAIIMTKYFEDNN